MPRQMMRNKPTKKEYEELEETTSKAESEADDDEAKADDSNESETSDSTEDDEDADATCPVRIVRDDDPAFARGHVLALLETEAGDFSESSQLPASVGSLEGLRAVLDDR